MRFVGAELTEVVDFLVEFHRELLAERNAAVTPATNDVVEAAVARALDRVAAAIERALKTMEEKET